MRQISHDPFAHQSLLRETVRALPGQSCQWCGSPGRASSVKGSNATFLYRYSVGPSHGRDMKIAHLFCSVSCMRTYHCD